MEQQIIQILNHIAVLNDEFGTIQVDVAILKFQMSQISFWFRALVMAFVVFGLSQIWQVYRMIKNK